MRTVKNILEKKAKASNIIPAGTLVIDALKTLNSVNLSYLIVMEGGAYKGLLTERDYSRNVILKGRTSASTRVEEIMTTDLPEVILTDTVEHCMNLMNTHKTRYLLALDADEKFAGIITIHDLLRQVIANKEGVFDSTLAQQIIDHDENGDIY